MKRVVCTTTIGGALATAMVLGFVGVGQAGHETSPVSVTGCINRGGSLGSLAVGNSPASPCATNETQVHLGGGDITSVQAGTGLQGGATEGEASLGLAPGYTLPQNCTLGQIAKARGGSWECGNDADNFTPSLFAEHTRAFVELVPPTLANGTAPDTQVASVVVGTGEYHVTATVWLQNANNFTLQDNSRRLGCRIAGGGPVFPIDINPSITDVDGFSEVTLPVQALVKVTEVEGDANTLRLLCNYSGGGTDESRMMVWRSTLTALRVNHTLTADMP